MEVLNNPEDRGERGSDPGLVEKIAPRLDRTGTASWSRSLAGSKREPLERPGNAKLPRLRHRVRFRHMPRLVKRQNFYPTRT